MVAVFSPTSALSWLMASAFLPNSASWLVVLRLSWSTLISSRRVDMANSARSWPLSAWISAIDTGIAAAGRRVVSRSARPCTNGMMMSASRLAARNPSPKYMIGSIMDERLLPSLLAEKTQCHAAGAGSSFPPERYAAAEPTLERVPGRPVGEFEIADFRAEPHADAGADGNEHDAVCRQHRHAETAHEIGRAVNAGEVLIDRGGGRQVIDQHHGARAFPAHVPAERGPLPEHLQVARVLRVEDAFAVTHPDHQRAARLLAEYIAVGQAPLAHGLLDDGGKPARDAAEEAVAGSDEFTGQEGVGWRSLRSRRRLHGRGLGKGGRAVQADEQKQQAEAAEDGAHGTPSWMVPRLTHSIPGWRRTARGRHLPRHPNHPGQQL